MALMQIMIFASTVMLCLSAAEKIRPIDVYRGKTKLEIVEKVVNGEVVGNIFDNPNLIN